MQIKSNFAILAWSILAMSPDLTSARMQWLERDGRAVYLYPRRFGQEQPAVLDKIRNACPGQVCGNLAGQAVTPLLAAQPECSQQDMADAIIDASKQFDTATQALMLAAAIEYRQVEKNTPPDFTTNTPTLRNSVFCQKAPKNPELNGLVQAQDPANDANIFFDPALGKSVTKGSQPNTFPFGTAGNGNNNNNGRDNGDDEEQIDIEEPVATGCVTEITVTVTGTAVATGPAITVTAGDSAITSAPAPTATAPAGADFGSCTVPEIEFGAGFDNRRETSFQPTDKQSFNHGSAQNIDIITRFICDTLTNSCKANQAAKNICAQAAAAASAAPAKTGAQADAFNEAFGLSTNFASVTVLDDQGRVIGGGNNGNTTSTTVNIPPNTLVATKSTSAAATTTVTPAAVNGNSAIGNFGSCTVPEIEFGAGFDNRRETSFQPADKVSYNHGSAQDIDIIAQFICDTLTNSCKADATAKATCQTARTAASASTKGSGAQADAFNKVFDITTNFASVQQLDNQGKAVGAATGSDNNQNNSGNTNQNNSTNQQINNNTSTVTAGNLQKFTGVLGGVTAPAVTTLSNGQFQVTGDASFNNQKDAVVRSCNVQNNQCANSANASGNQNGFNVAACSAQQSQCIAQAN